MNRNIIAFLDLNLTSIACTFFLVIITLVFLRFKRQNMWENSPSFPSILRRRPSLPSSSLVSDHHKSHSHQNTPSSSVVPFDISHAPQIKYDVFISFRGSDARRGFLSHLHKTLQIQKGVETYVDYKLREGNELSSQLLTAIEQSQIALVILSKDYASSGWCLEELDKIIECRMKYGQIVIPIFYNIDPSYVRYQKGCYENAFTKHEKRFKDNIMTVEKWRCALRCVANLSGFHSASFGTEVELIEEVVQRVLNRLNHMPQFDLHGLIGISRPISKLQSLIFCDGSKDVRVIGIWGMGGIGKTTLASALFRILCSEYESCYFLANVREQVEKYGIPQLQNNLLCKLLEEKDLNTGVPASAHVLRRLSRKKILLVLDDVGNPDQVRELVGGPPRDSLGPGSRIIVTTRDKHVLRKDADDIYEVKALEVQETLRLLTLHAFNGKGIQTGYRDLVVKVAEYAKGVPLALKVLGSFLYGKSTEEWKSQLDKLQKMPFEGIQKVLRLSYEGLDREEQKILLCIVCFFERSFSEISGGVTIFLDACGYSTTIALRNLEDRTLITREQCGSGAYVVHDLIRQMCQEIAREQNIDKPGERHHLWDPHDIRRVLEYEEGTESIETISLDISKIDNLSLSSNSFARMYNLKLLKIYASENRFCNTSVEISEGHLIFRANLRLFSWAYYPLKSLPPELKLENLVELSMEWSRVEKLWDGTQNLPNLNVVFLNNSKQLRELPDLSKALSLRSLYLVGCENLVSVHPSVFSLPKLVRVYLHGCKRLERLEGVLSEEASQSTSSSSSNLKKLDFSGCTRLKRLPDSFSKLTSLEELSLKGCKELDTSNLHIIFDGFSSLKNLCLDKCDKLYEVPHNISNLSLLKELSLEGSNVKSMPESIKYLARLVRLRLNNCERLESLPEIPPFLQYLHADGCKSLERVFTPTRLLYLQHIESYETYLENSDNFHGYHYDTYFSLRNCPKLEKIAIARICEYHSNSCTNQRRIMFAERMIRRIRENMPKDVKEKMATRGSCCFSCCHRDLGRENDSFRMMALASYGYGCHCSCHRGRLGGPQSLGIKPYNYMSGTHYLRSSIGRIFSARSEYLPMTRGTSCGDPPWLQEYLHHHRLY